MIILDYDLFLCRFGMDIMTSATTPNDSSVEPKKSEKYSNCKASVSMHDRVLDRTNSQVSSR